MGCAQSIVAGPDLNAVLELGNGTQSFGHDIVSTLGKHDGTMFGVHKLPSKKNQDGFAHAYAPRSGPRTLGAYAIFDGHGQSTTAMELAKANLLNLILPADASTPVLHDSIVSAFEQTSLKIMNSEMLRTGTTATVILIAGSLKDPARPRFTVTCAWVGDSRCCMVTPKGKVLRLSVDHQLNNSSERKFIEEDSKEHAEATGQRGTFIARRANECGDEGPWALFNGQPNSYTLDEDELSDEVEKLSGAGLMDLSQKGRVRATSTLVTRALGDAHGSESMSSTPEIIQVQNVKPGSRIIIGSDGMWDVFTNQQAVARIKHVSNPQRAAAKLAKEAKQERLYRGMSMDDITVFVVNVEEPAYPFAAAAAAGPSSLQSEVSKSSRPPLISEISRPSFDYSRGSFVVESVHTSTVSKWKLRAQSPNAKEGEKKHWDSVRAESI